MDHKRMPEHKRGHLQMLYVSVFNETLNPKWSSCEQSSGKIVRQAVAKNELTAGEDFFNTDELCKLKRATTEGKMQAFYWYFGTFLKCV